MISVIFTALELFDYIVRFGDLGCKWYFFYVGLSNKLFTKLEVYVMFGSLCWGHSICHMLYIN